MPTTQAISSSLTWSKANIPYQVTSTYSFFLELDIEDGTVTIEPGTEIFFEDGTGILVRSGGALVANGTASEPITFSGVNQVPGAWTAIYFSNPSTVNNQISHARIQYAGAEIDGERGGIVMRTAPTLRLENLAFSDINGCSTFHKDIALNANLTYSNLTHSNTAGEHCHQ